MDNMKRQIKEREKILFQGVKKDKKVIDFEDKSKSKQEKAAEKEKILEKLEKDKAILSQGTSSLKDQ